MLGGVFLYIICGYGRSHEPLGPVKIGIASDPEKRIASLQTGSPRPLKILAVFDTPNREIARKFEAAFHRHYDDERLAGEWFDIDPIDALEMACGSFRSYLEGMSSKLEDSAGVMELCGIPHNEREIRRFKAWRQYYAENSNVRSIA